MYEFFRRYISSLLADWFGKFMVMSGIVGSLLLLLGWTLGVPETQQSVALVLTFVGLTVAQANAYRRLKKCMDRKSDSETVHRITQMGLSALILDGYLEYEAFQNPADRHETQGEGVLAWEDRAKEWLVANYGPAEAVLFMDPTAVNDESRTKIANSEERSAAILKTRIQHLRRLSADSSSGPADN